MTDDWKQQTPDSYDCEEGTICRNCNNEIDDDEIFCCESCHQEYYED